MAGRMREFDVVVLGATGVTGRRVAAYLAGRDGVRWAAAGRDAGRVREALAAEGVAAPAVLEADALRPDRLAALAARTRVILNLVGPYARFGPPVLDAAVAHSAHVLDLSGEMPYLRRTVRGWDSRARGAGIAIVQPCGFESLPPDLAVRLAAEEARRRFGEPLAEVEVVASATPPPGRPRADDMISGGTTQSLVEALADPEPEAVLDPAALVEDPRAAAAIRRLSPIGLLPRSGPDGAVLAPMVPVAFINPAVVQRTAALAGDPPLRYREGMAIAGPAVTLPLRWGAAGVLSGVQLSLRIALGAPAPARGWLSRRLASVLPSSGFGPSPDRLDWRWTMRVTGRTPSRGVVRVLVEGEGHPGYLTTARMLAEAGLQLAEHGPDGGRAGALTPALALGTSSIPRFRAAGLRIVIDG